MTATVTGTKKTENTAFADTSKTVNVQSECVGRASGIVDYRPSERDFDQRVAAGRIGDRRLISTL
jgi:hypothetical protein